MAVTLELITKDNVREVCRLELGPGQENFVASNAVSLAEAYVQPDTARPRAVAADGQIVGFLLLEINPDDDDGRPFYLWRFMIDHRHQRKGYGRDALRLAVDEVRGRGATELYTSWVPGEGTPEPFYHQFGFVETGEIDEDEKVARLVLT